MIHLIKNAAKRTITVKEDGNTRERVYVNASVSAIDSTMYGLYSNDKLVGTFPKDEKYTSIEDETEEKKKDA